MKAGIATGALDFSGNVLSTMTILMTAVGFAGAYGQIIVYDIMQRPN
jgi:hypothetical protein